MTSLKKPSAALVYLGLAVGAVITLAPFGLGLLTSFTSAHQFATGPPLTWPRPPTLVNYTNLGGAGFGRALAVTALMTAVSLLGQLSSSVVAAYAFARLRFPGRDELFWVYLATLMVPGSVTVVPLYLMMAQLGLRNTFWALVLPFVFGSPYAIFLLRQHFRTIPDDLINAAYLDGATTLDVRIVLQTDDGAAIGLQYRGLRHGPADVMDKVNSGQFVDPSQYYFRTIVTFETASPKYAWLNKVFGVGTGRPRRCGWFDAVAVRQAVKTGGITGIALTKLDVLDGFDEIKICTAYRRGGETYDFVPAAMTAQAELEPVYESAEGWDQSTRGARSWADLPATAIKYIRRIEEVIEAPVALLSTSPERDDTILVRDPFAT